MPTIEADEGDELEVTVAAVLNKTTGKEFSVVSLPKSRQAIIDAGGDAREFDLRYVGFDGSEERITTAPSFDGFPMFSPDGKWLVFASNRANAPGARDTDLYLARWVP